MNNKKVLILVVTIVVIVIFGIYIILSSNNNKVTTQINNNIIEETNQEDITKNDNLQNDIIIKKSEITSTVKFYKYKSGDINMEVMAVKATDGSIRTALNTCQVCYDSGRGYYKQVGSIVVCQNCGNQFSIDQIEKIKGGCNPIPVLTEDKTETNETITISKEYLDSQKMYFENWKK